MNALLVAVRAFLDVERMFKRTYPDLEVALSIAELDYARNEVLLHAILNQLADMESRVGAIQLMIPEPVSQSHGYCPYCGQTDARQSGRTPCANCPPID